MCIRDSTNAFGAGAYAKTGAKNYAIRQGAGYRVGLFALEGEESYGYCKNSDLTRMDCAEAVSYTHLCFQGSGLLFLISFSSRQRLRGTVYQPWHSLLVSPLRTSHAVDL